MFGCPVEYFDQPQPVYEPFGLMPQGMAQFGILEHMNGTIEGDQFAQTWTDGPKGSDYGGTVHLPPGEYPPPPPPDYDPTLGPPTIYTGGGIGPIPPPKKRLKRRDPPPPPPPDPSTVRQTLKKPPPPPPPPPPTRKWLRKPLLPSDEPQQLWKPDKPKRPYPSHLQKPWKPPVRPSPQRLQKRNTGPNYR